MTEAWGGEPFRALLRGKEEDRFTAYLCELLKSPLVLATFLRDLCCVPDVATRADKLGIFPQESVSGGRPDIVIRGANVRLIFEAKVQSWLHEDQLVPYACDLAKQDEGITKHLYLLVPSDSRTWALDAGTRQLQAARVQDITLRAVTWEDIGMAMQQLAAQPALFEREPRLCMHLNDFASLITHKFGSPLRRLSHSDVEVLGSENVARLLLHVETLVSQVETSLRKTLGLVSTTWSAQRNRKGGHYTGFYFDASGHTHWFGFWHDAWANYGHSPFFLQFCEQAIDEVKATYGPGAIDDGLDGHPIVPIRVTEGPDLSAVSEALADQVVNYIRAIPSA